MPAHIKHIAYYLPEKIYSNEDFFRDFPASRENRGLKKLGIDQRRIAAHNETAADMATKAARQLIANHHIDAVSIDFLLYVSFDFDYYTPATSCVIHEALGLAPHCGTLDQTHGCSAYVYALSTAKGLIEANGLNNVLVLTASTLTKRLHPGDRACKYLFGDAASATLVVNKDGQGIGQMAFGTDSKNFQKIIVRDGGDKYPITDTSYDPFTDEFGNTTSHGDFYMDGVGVFLFTMRRVPELVSQALQKNKLTQNDIDMFVFHQASGHIVDTLAKKMQIPEEKLFNYTGLVGNTVSSSIAITLAEGLKQNKIKKNDRVMLIGFGVGLSLAATVVTI